MATHIPRRWASIAVIVLTAGLISACGGAAPSSSWPGLAVSEHIAYLASTDRVYAIDTRADTNNQQRLLWAFPPLGQNASVTFHGRPLLFDNGILYEGSDSPSGNNNFVVALDTTRLVDTGEAPDLTKTVEVKWTYPTGDNPPPVGNIFAGLTTDGQSVIAGTGKGEVLSLAADPGGQFGQLNWVYTTTERIWSSPVVSGSMVYVASQDHNLYALDAQTGAERWTFQAGAALPGTPTVYGDTVYAGSFDQKMYAVDAQTGAKRWEFQAQGWLWDGPTVFDDVLYFGDLNGHLYAVTLDGTPAWEQPITLEGMLRASPLVTQDTIYAPTAARKLYAVNRATRNVDWTFTALHDGEELLTTPVLVDSTLLIPPLPSGASPVRLYALNAKSGNLMWQYPPPAPQ